MIPDSEFNSEKQKREVPGRSCASDLDIDRSESSSLECSRKEVLKRGGGLDRLLVMMENLKKIGGIINTVILKETVTIKKNH